MKQTIHTILAQCREEAASNRDLGDRFERASAVASSLSARISDKPNGQPDASQPAPSKALLNHV